MPANTVQQWKRVSIQDACTSIIDCVNKTAPKSDVSTPYKMLRTTNVKNGWVLMENLNSVTEEVFKKWTRRQIPQKGDVILTREAPLGEVGLLRVERKVFLGQRLVAYRADPTKLDNRFLLYSFLAPDLKRQVMSFGSGATVEHMRVPDAEKLTVLLPDLPTQQRIADVLSAYDDLIENNNRRIKILEETVQKIYTEWFVNFRFPGHEHVKMVDTGTEFGMIPEGWEVKVLSDVVDINPSYNTKNQRDFKKISMDRLSNDSMLIDTDRIEMFSKVSGSKFKNHDVLFARITPCLENGKTGYVQCLKENEIAFGSTEYIVMRGSKVPNTFVYCLARNSEFRKAAQKTMSGASGRQRVANEFFKKYMVAVPTPEILKMFQEIVGTAFTEIEELRKTNQNLKKSRDLLIPQLVTGKRNILI